MRLTAFATALLTTLPAAAHTGHVEASAGHSHWLALAAIVAAGGVAIWRLIRTRAAKTPETAKVRGN